MATVEITVSVSIGQDGMSMQELEDAVGVAVEEAGRDLLRRACHALEDSWLERRPALNGGAGQTALRRSKRRSLDLLTRFGWIRLSRWQMRDAQGRYHQPLDSLLGLQPRQHASPWITAQAVALATRLPYRQATQLLSGFVGQPLDHRSLYAWVRSAGAELVAEEDKEQEAVFVQGELPPRDPQSREIVLAEVDGTFLPAQREQAPEFEVRLGLLTSGKALESLSAKHHRYRLLERVRYAGVETAQNFGERFFLRGEAHLGLSHARHLLLVGDGAEWIEVLAGQKRWQAIYQLDWWHLIHAFHRTFPAHPQLVEELKQALYRGEGNRVVQLVRTARATGTGDQQRVVTLLKYVRTNEHGFYGARSLRPFLSDQGRLVCVEGSGAVEKQMDLVVARRFKKQGMRWSRRGANWLLKLRLQELDKTA
jgi:hypothetical protein